MPDFANLLNGLFESINIAIFIVDASGKLVYANQEYCTLCGYSREELLGKSLTELLPDELKEEGLLVFKKRFNEDAKGPAPIHWPLKRKDGKIIMESFCSYNLKLENGEKFRVVLVTGENQDVKNRGQLEFHASILEAQSTFLVRLSPSGLLKYANKAFLSYFNFGQDIKEKCFRDLVAPQDYSNWENLFLQFPQAGSSIRFDLRMKKEEGHIVWTSWEFVAISGPGGEVNGFQGSGVDVSNRKRIEKERDDLIRNTQALNEELRASEEELRQNLERAVELREHIQKNERKFRSLLENSFEAIILFDEAGFITYASPSIERTLGYTPEEMVGKKGMWYVHEEDKAQSRALLGQMMEKPGNRVYIQQRVRRKDGNYVWIESYSTNLLHNEDVKGIVSNFRDVTERIEWEEKLKAREAMLNQAQYVAKLGSTEFDLVTGNIYNSPGVYSLYDYDLSRYPKEEFDGAVFVHPDDVSKFQNLFKNTGDFGEDWLKNIRNLPKAALEEVEEEPFEFRIISAEGRLKYLRSRHRFFTDENGSAVKLIVTIQDVSEEKHRERLLEETSSIAKIGGWELDLSTNTYFPTPQILKILGLEPPEKVPFGSEMDLYHPDFRPAIQQALQALIAEGIPYDLEAKMVTAQEKQIWVRGIGRAEKVNGKIVMIRGVIQDITDRKEAEREINEYAERLRLATQAAGIGIWDWDLKTNKVMWDEQLRREYGVSEEQEEVGFEDYQKALHPDDVEEQELVLQEAFKTGKLESEFRIITPNSEVKWLKGYGKVIYDENKKPVRMIGLNWDITRLKQTEEILLRNNEELLKTNEELDHFVYSTSHNLRAPLTSILGIVNLMKNYSNPDDNPTYISLIEKSVMKLDETIQEITNYSRNTRVEVNVEPIQFDSLIQEILESLSFLEDAGRIKISYIAPNTTFFFSDRSRLKMIFTNLISNAIKYSDPAQPDPFIFILVEKSRKGVSIRIKDNGIGIAGEHQEKVFNMFFRASTKSTGSGLGLYIVKEAVRKLSGTIEVDSKPGKGTEFIIELPNQV